MVTKVLKAGYYQPIMRLKYAEFIKKCLQCQQHCNLIHQSNNNLNDITSPCPFTTWGIDILGAFPLPGNKSFYLWQLTILLSGLKSKHSRPLPQPMFRNFYGKISSCDSAFHIMVCNLQIKKLGEFVKGLGITHRVTLVEHP